VRLGVRTEAHAGGARKLREPAKIVSSRPDDGWRRRVDLVNGVADAGRRESHRAVANVTVNGQ
jgi:hypothetical protein